MNVQNVSSSRSYNRLYNRLQSVNGLYVAVVVVVVVIDAARMVCGAASMKRSSVRPSVCLSRQSTAATAAGGYAVQRACRHDISIDICGRRAAGVGAQLQDTAARRSAANVDSVTFTADVGN